METTAPKAFKKVFIKSETDLPKEKGFYIIGFKNGIVQGMNYSIGDRHDLLDCARWYYKPVDHVSYGREEIKAELIRFLKVYHTSMFVIDLENTKIDFEEIVEEYLATELSEPKESCLSEIKEDNANVFLIDRDANSARLYKNGVRVSPEEFTTIYGCEMTEDQKKLLEVIKRDYFNALPEVKESGNDVTDLRTRLIKLIKDGYNLEAIRTYKKEMECSLSDAKYNITMLRNELDIEARNGSRLHPAPPLTDQQIEKWAKKEMDSFLMLN